MKILIIEDNKLLAQALSRALKEHYLVTIVHTGKAGTYELDVNTFDLVLLDLGLPDMTGLEVCLSARRLGVKTPILVLTASDVIFDKVAMLDAGADDYLIKPFETKELLARLRALQRRGITKILPTILQHGLLQLDVAARVAHYDGERLVLRRRELDLLEYMLRNVGMVLTRSMIFDHVWGTENELWSNVVDAQIRSLRSKVDRKYGVRLIRTVYGIGYTIDREGK